MIKEQPSAAAGLDWAAPQLPNVDPAQQFNRVLGDAIGNQQTRRCADYPACNASTSRGWHEAGTWLG